MNDSMSQNDLVLSHSAIGGDTDLRGIARARDILQRAREDDDDDTRHRSRLRQQQDRAERRRRRRENEAGLVATPPRMTGREKTPERKERNTRDASSSSRGSLMGGGVD